MKALRSSEGLAKRPVVPADQPWNQRPRDSAVSNGLPRTNVLGVGISAINLEQAVAQVGEWIAGRDGQYVCVTGVHGVMESQRHPDVRHAHNAAGLVTPDGMPMVWLSRLNGYDHVRRVYGPEFMSACCAESSRAGYRHYLYGGGEGVAEKLRGELTSRFPGLQIVGTTTPPFRNLTPEEDDAVVADINESGADIVWVGLSTPKQERWMYTHRDCLTAPVLVGVGAAFDFLAGLKKQAPRWMQSSGLEWLFRLLDEPRRLAPRYLVNNPLFVIMLAGQLLGVRRYTL